MHPTPRLPRALAALLLAAAGIAHAAGTEPLAGVVVDADTGEPLSDVNVVYAAVSYTGMTLRGRGRYNSTLFIGETVSGRGGTFEFASQRIRAPLLGVLRPYGVPYLYFFKPGYAPVRHSEARDDNPTLSEIKHWRTPVNPVALKKFEGTPAQYARAIGAAGDPFEPLYELGPCDWERLPRLLEAMGHVSQSLDDAGVGRVLGYDTLVREDGRAGCRSFRDFTLKHFPALGLMPAFDRDDAVALRAALAAGADATRRKGEVSLLAAAVKARKLDYAGVLLERPELQLTVADQAALFREAGRAQRADLLEQVLGRGLDVNVADEHGATPLMHAAAAGLRTTVRALIARGADVNATTRQRTNVLAAAVKPRYHSEVVRELLEAGARPIALEGRSILVDAATQDPELARKLIRDGVVLSDTQGPTPLAEAARAGHTDVVRMLLAVRPALYGRDQLVEALVGGAHSRTREIVQLLMPGIEQLQLAERQKIVSVAWEDPPLLELLLDWPAMAPIEPRLFADALVAAAARESVTDVEALLLRGVAVNSHSNWGETALTVAAQRRRTATVALLLTMGANPNLPNAAGVTPLMLAADGGLRERPETVLLSGGPASAGPVLQPTAAQSAAEAAPAANRPVAQAMPATPRYRIVAGDAQPHPQSPAIMELLLKAGARLNLRGKDGWTALMRATAMGCSECARLLLDRGARTDLRNVEGQTVRDVARDWGRPEIERLLKR